MSLTMHLYDEEICEGHFCPKDCEECSPYADMVIEKEGQDMSYSERLANYQREKLNIKPDLIKNDPKLYEAALKALAKKWRI